MCTYGLPICPLGWRAYRYMDIHVCTCHIMVFGGLGTSKYGSKRVQIWDPQIWGPPNLGPPLDLRPLRSGDPLRSRGYPQIGPLQMVSEGCPYRVLPALPRWRLSGRHIWPLRGLGTPGGSLEGPKRGPKRVILDPKYPLFTPFGPTLRPLSRHAISCTLIIWALKPVIPGLAVLQS